MKLGPGSRRALPWAILAACFALFVAQAYPGYTSVDSAVSLGEARAHHYTDWHPPAMAGLWHILDSIVSGPILMLLLQGALLLAGFYRVLRRDLSPIASAAFAGGLLLFPPVLSPMSVIWKDCQMAAFLWLGTSLVLEERWRPRIAGMACLALATAMRHNAPVATIPLFLFAMRLARPWWKQAVIAGALWIATTAVAFTTDKLLTDETQHTWHASVGPMDIIGVLKYAPLPDDQAEEVLRGTPLVVHKDISRHAHRIYTPTNFWWMMNGDKRMFDWPQTAEQRAAIERAWRELVTAHPLAYLHHRYRVFLEALGMSRRPVFDPAWRGHVVSDQKLEPPYDDNGFQLAVGKALMWLATKTFLFRASLYFLVALALLPMARRHLDILGILLAGIGYELTLLPFASTPDFRYSHYMITCALIAVIVLTARRMRSDPQREPPTREQPHE